MLISVNPVPLLIALIPLSKPLIMPFDWFINKSDAVSLLEANIAEPLLAVILPSLKIRVKPFP